MTSAKQVSAQYTQEFKLEAVRQVKAGQAIAVVAKVLGIPKASLSTWVRLVTQGKLDCGEVTGKAVRVTPQQMELAHLRAEVARLRMERNFTYIQTEEGWLYLTAVIDLFSRQVVGWGACSRICRRVRSRMRWLWRGGVDGPPA